MKRRMIWILLAGILMELALSGLYKHFVTDQIMDGGNGMENPDAAFLLDGDQRGLIALRALSAQHVLCLAAAGALFVGPAALLAELPGAALRLCRGLPPGKLRSGDGPDVKNGAAHSLTTTGPSGGRRHIPAER